MKKLYLIRHAKSSWGDFNLPDFDRPLNDRGKSDAPMMAKRLSERKVAIDAFVSSPAKRAKKTCKFFCSEFGVKEDRIIFIESLYLASADMFFSLVRSFDNRYSNVAVFSHNPGITEFANRLCRDARVDDMPTCSIFAAELDINNWKDLEESANKFLFFDFPRNGN